MDFQLPMNGYVPEGSFFKGKDGRSERLCMEKIAVIDALHGYRVLVRHSFEIDLESDLFSAFGIDRDEKSYFMNALETHRRLLLHGSLGEVLVLGDWLSETGLLLAVALPESRGVLMQALGLMRREDIAISPFPAEALQAVAHPIDDAIGHLSELFFYLDRIFSTDYTLGLMTRVLLIGAFVGCRVSCEALPVEFPALCAADSARLSAFLLCSLITLRRQNHPVLATAEGNSVLHNSFLCRLDYTARNRPLENSETGKDKNYARGAKKLGRRSGKWEPLLELAFLEHEAFRSFDIDLGERTLSLEAPMIPATFSSLLYATGELLFLRLILENTDHV